VRLLSREGQKATYPAKAPGCQARAALAWRAPHDFATGLARTVDWYLANRAWWEGVRARRYAGERLGTKSAA